jgi:hypothetical protein
LRLTRHRRAGLRLAGGLACSGEAWGVGLVSGLRGSTGVPISPDDRALCVRRS